MTCFRNRGLVGLSVNLFVGNVVRVDNVHNNCIGACDDAMHPVDPLASSLVSRDHSFTRVQAKSELYTYINEIQYCDNPKQWNRKHGSLHLF